MTEGNTAPRRQVPPSRIAAWAAELADILAREEAQRTTRVPYPEKTSLQYAKWQQLHKIVHATPVHVSDRLPRHEQWMAIRDYVWRAVGEREVIEWVTLQVEVARNIAAGIQDLRPRKDGPCHELLLEYVANRKRKALAVHHWALSAAETDGPPDYGIADDPAG
ncbi:MAG: hypothetical protein H7840_06565 [Alphaproteobacteria bacterium]